MFKKKAFGILIALYILFSSNYDIYSVEASNTPVSKKTAKEDVQETDFGPYMKDLQQAIKKNWIPPKGKESKHVVVAFSIARDGRLLNLNIKNSSGNKEVDERAIKAVKLTSPFKALPSDFKGDKVDIHFTFDYKVSQISTKYNSRSYNDVENLVQYLLAGDTEKVKNILQEKNIREINDIIYKETGSDLLECVLILGEPNAELVDLAIKAGVDVNRISKKSKTRPLHTILMRKNIKDPVDIVNLLINSGADVNAVDERGFNAIFMAVLNAHIESFKLLLRCGYRFTGQNRKREPASKSLNVKKTLKF